MPSVASKIQSGESPGEADAVRGQLPARKSSRPSRDQIRFAADRREPIDFRIGCALAIAALMAATMLTSPLTAAHAD